MDVLVGFQFEHSQAAFASGGQHVHHGAVGCGEGGDLGVHAGGVQPLIDGAHVGNDQRLQPTLGVQAPQGMATRPVGMADLSGTLNEIGKLLGVLLAEHALFGAYAKDNFLLAVERIGIVSEAGAGEFEASPAEGNFCRRERCDGALWKQFFYAADGIGKAFPGRCFVDAMHQARGNVATIGAVYFAHCLFALFQFEQLPLRGIAIQMGHTFPHQCGRASG